MKTCPYCGKEYPDDAVVCAVDQTPLDPPVKDADQKSESPAAGVEVDRIRKDDSDLVYPDYQWSARDGWKFLGMSLVFTLLAVILIAAVCLRAPGFYRWTKGPVGFFSLAVIYAGICLLTAAYFTRIRSFAVFCSVIGLDRKPSGYVWFGVAAALGIQLLAHITFVLGWTGGYAAYDLRSFRNDPGAERYLSLLPLLLAPFWEEAVNRGFLYKAFRGSYSVQLSIACLVGYTLYTHLDHSAHSIVAAICLSAVTVVQCKLREKSDSLWDCILCHLVFNGYYLFVNYLQQ